MTIREKFAAMVLQGLMANPNDIPQIAGKTDPNNPAGQLAQVSLKIADALLKELEKKTK